MPPRGSEGLDFTPILTHYLFLFTSVLAIVGWFIAFVSQAFVTARGGRGFVGSLWFAIFLELFLIIGVLYTLASDAIAMHRFQIAVFGAIAIVFSVDGVNINIFGNTASQNALSAGWLILSIVNILWVLYFTSEEDSLVLHIFNSMGTGGLTPPSRRRRTRTQSLHNMGAGNGYAAGYSAGGIGSQDVAYDAKVGTYGNPPSGLRSQTSFAASADGANRSIGAGTGAAGSIHNLAVTNTASIGGGDNGPHSPLMAGIGAGGSQGNTSAVETLPPADGFAYKARALFTYNANPEDPNEISFNKGEILDIVDKNGKWWQARKADGSVGIAPSNYLSLI